MNLFLGEITKNDKDELLSMIDEINKSNDYEKFEGLSNIKKVTKERDIEIQYFKQNPVARLYERLGFIKNGETRFHYQMIRKKG